MRLTASENPSELVRLLDADPDLGSALSAADFEAARRLSAVHIETLGCGPWTPPHVDADTLGLLVLEGIAGARITVGDRAGMELVGEGDLLRPWVGAEDRLAVWTTRWSVFAPLQVASIDVRLTPLLTRWPALLSAIIERQIRRHRRLIFQLAVMALNSVEDRLLQQFWYLAERWGRVTPEGVVLDLPLSHRDIADLVGARRPSVTSALTTLRRDGRVLPREERGQWLLTGHAPPDLDRLRLETEVEPPVAVAGRRPKRSAS